MTPVATIKEHLHLLYLSRRVCKYTGSRTAKLVPSQDTIQCAGLAPGLSFLPKGGGNDISPELEFSFSVSHSFFVTRSATCRENTPLQDK